MEKQKRLWKAFPTDKQLEGSKVEIHMAGMADTEKAG